MPRTRRLSPPAPKPGQWQLVGGQWPLVANRTGRRQPSPAIARADPTGERQARYCLGFDPDWWLPALLAGEWQSFVCPVEATAASVDQWSLFIDHCRMFYLGVAGMPERAVKWESHRSHDLELIRQAMPGLVVTEAATQPIADQSDGGAWLTHLDLARQYKCDEEAARQRLNRWRTRHNHLSGKDWIENPDRRHHDPGYLYRVDAVRHLFSASA